MEQAIGMFEATHELAHADGRSWWRRTALPDAGGIAQQDPALMDALQVLKRVYDDMVQPREKQQTHG